MWRCIADYHTHTRYSHGTGSVMDNVEAAHQCGLKIVGIADHGPANWWNVGIRDLSEFDRIIEDVERARDRYPEMTILAGTEANIISYDGELDVPEDIQNRLDQILVGFHTMIIPKSWDDGLRFVRLSVAARFGQERFNRAMMEHTKALVNAVRRYHVDIVTHPGLKVAVDSRELGAICAERGTMLEINARHGIASIGFIERAAATDVKFVLSSDAHRPADVGRLAPAVEAGVRVGLSPERIANIIVETLEN